MPNDRGAIAHQCGRKRGFGKDGLYCKLHDPEAVKAKRAARTAAYDAEWKQKEKDWAIRDKSIEIVDIAKRLVPIRSFGQEFDALVKAVEELKKIEES